MTFFLNVTDTGKRQSAHSETWFDGALYRIMVRNWTDDQFLLYQFSAPGVVGWDLRGRRVTHGGCLGAHNSAES